MYIKSLSWWLQSGSPMIWYSVLCESFKNGYELSHTLFFFQGTTQFQYIEDFEPAETLSQ